MPQRTLSPQLLALFTGLVEEACGLYYGPGEHGLFASKVAAHADELAHDSLLDFYYRLRYDDPDRSEITRFVEALLVHETYFFRELPSLVQLVDGHLAPILASRGRARVWSAACATGEEPYTLAMLLADRGLLDRVEIIATDVSALVIQKARTGPHPRRSLRDGRPVETARRYLETGPGGVIVAPRIRDSVAFATLNLLEADAIARLGTFDVILCRNVLIYFRDAQVTRVIAALGSALAPDGLLAVGVTESMLRFGTALVCEERDRSFFYRVPR